LERIVADIRVGRMYSEPKSDALPLC